MCILLMDYDEKKYCLALQRVREEGMCLSLSQTMVLREVNKPRFLDAGRARGREVSRVVRACLRMTSVYASARTGA
jgi:hypothetical protein